jgi:hypothetical protein
MSKLAERLREMPELQARLKHFTSKVPIVADDGATRTRDEQADIDAAAARLFSCPDGELVLGYLRSITLDYVTGPHEAECAVRHLEGQRYLFAVIQRAVMRGKQHR